MGRAYRAPLMTTLERLVEPKPEVDLNGLCALWRQAEVIATAPRPRDFAADESLPGRVRGALGRVIMEHAAHCPRALLAFELMFEEPALWRSTFPNLPRPFVLSSFEGGGHVRICVRLFGFAAPLAPYMANWLREALERGLAVAETSPVRTALHAKDIVVRRQDGITTRLEVGGWAYIVFRSPVTVLQGERSVVSEERILGSLAARVANMAAWQDVSVPAETVARPWTGMDWRLITDGATSIRRNSKRQRRSALSIQGHRVRLAGRGAGYGIEQLLKIGERVHAGARSAFGFGAFRSFVTGNM